MSIRRISKSLNNPHNRPAKDINEDEKYKHLTWMKIYCKNEPCRVNLMTAYTEILYGHQLGITQGYCSEKCRTEGEEEWVKRKQ